MPQKPSAPSKQQPVEIQQKIQDAGVILRSLPGDSLAFCPPLIIEDDQIHEMFDKIEEAIIPIDVRTPFDKDLKKWVSYLMKKKRKILG